MKKVWIVQNDWRFCGDSGHDFAKVFDDEQKARNEFIEYLVNERCNTWLGDFVDDELNPVEGQELDEYDFSDTHFCAESYAYDARTEVWIESFDVE
jgi:hypothetical protein